MICIYSYKKCKVDDFKCEYVDIQFQVRAVTIETEVIFDDSLSLLSLNNVYVYIEKYEGGSYSMCGFGCSGWTLFGRASVSCGESVVSIASSFSHLTFI